MCVVLVIGSPLSKLARGPEHNITSTVQFSARLRPCPERLRPCPERLRPCPARLRPCPARLKPCPARKHKLRCVAMQMRKANQALAELAAQQKAVALGGSAKARYREAQVNSANECLHRLELSSLEDLQQEIAAMQQQLEIDEQVHEVPALLTAWFEVTYAKVANELQVWRGYCCLLLLQFRAGGCVHC